MKDLTLSAVAVLVLALGIGLAFHWIFPLVLVTNELAGLFFFVALVLKLALSKAWSMRQTQRGPPKAEAHK